MWGELGGPATVKTAPLPIEFSLAQNYPNPFNPSTMIHYSLADDSKVTLEIYNMRGRLVKTLVERRQPAGAHDIQWSAIDEFGIGLASGIYLCKLHAQSEANEFVETRKMMLMR